MIGLKGVKYKAMKINLPPIDLSLPEIKECKSKNQLRNKTKS